jgi:alpha-L-fucosidase
MLWFDHVAGNWRDYRFQELFEMMYRLHPNLLVNDRAARFIRATDDRPSPALASLVQGDFDTPEQRIGKFQYGRAWESCVTITECKDGGGWSYRPDGRTRSFEECLRLLVNAVTGDGNLLLNVGPLPSGEIASDQVAVLKQIGTWLDHYGESIYGTRGGPFRNGAWGGSTYKDKSIYLHVIQWTGDTLQLPPLKAKVLRSVALTGGNVGLEQTASGLKLVLPHNQQDKTDTVIKLDLDSAPQHEFIQGEPLSVGEAPH